MRKEKLEELKSYLEELKAIEFIKHEQSKKFLKSDSYLVKLNNGIIIPREKLIKGKNDGSASIIMPVLTNNEILIVVEPRVFTETTVGVGFPAGYIEQNNGIIKESPKESAIRELKEETGYYPERIIEIDSFYQDEGCSSALNHLFIAYNCEKKFNQHLDEFELIRYMSLKYDELFELEDMGYIKGSNSKLLLEKSKKYMKGC